MGLSSALEHFQSEISKLFLGQKGIIIISDDILVHGANKEEHDQALRNCLKILKDSITFLTMKLILLELGMDIKKKQNI